MPPPLLPRVHIADMDLHEGDLNRQQRVPQRDTRVREGRGVDDDPRGAVGAGAVDAVDEGAFVVGLEMDEINGETFAAIG